MRALKPVRVVGGVLLVLGLAIVGVGLYKRSTLPPEISSQEFLSGAKSIDDIGRRNDAEFSATGWLMGGGFVAFVGLMQLLAASRTVRRAGNAIVQEQAQAVALGLREGLAGRSAEDRLSELDGLRAKGLVNDSEYAAKRREILETV